MATRIQWRKPTHTAKPKTSFDRGYDRQWRKVRQLALARDSHLCRDCLERDKVTAASEVHHVVKIEQRPDLRLCVDNLRSLCRDCHDVRTARGE